VDAPYSPQRRTAVLLCGTGTAGAYQAGVLRALSESGIKIDVAAGHGPGVANALVLAIDAGARLWAANGPWTAPALGLAYRWRLGLRLAGIGVGAAGVLMLLPLAAVVVATALYAASVVAALVNLESASLALVAWYQQILEWLFSPPILPTVMPRALVLVLLAVVAVLVASAMRAAPSDGGRRTAGGWWWRLFGAPLDGAEPGATVGAAIRGIVQGGRAGGDRAAEVGRGYVTMLTENLGQPGFRELVIGLHDLDARRDVVGALLDDEIAGRFDERRPGSGVREAEILDFAGPAGDLVAEFAQAALRVPVATPAWPLTYPTEGYWRGERHHACDRPDLALRLVLELERAGVEQLIVVGASPPASGPHALRSRPNSLRGRIGAHARSMETAALDAAVAAAATRFQAVFVVRPDHNPIGPFDFRGVYDDASDRRLGLADLLDQGYDDAIRVFVEPAVAAGEQTDAETPAY
jgi:hypothetical protein